MKINLLFYLKILSIEFEFVNFYLKVKIYYY